MKAHARTFHVSNCHPVNPEINCGKVNSTQFAGTRHSNHEQDLKKTGILWSKLKKK